MNRSRVELDSRLFRANKVSLEMGNARVTTRLVFRSMTQQTKKIIDATRIYPSYGYRMLKHLQLDVLERLVADGASNLSLLLVLLILVDGSAVLRSCKHKEEKARETTATPRNR